MDVPQALYLQPKYGQCHQEKGISKQESPEPPLTFSSLQNKTVGKFELHTLRLLLL
jgi:hypothetical protein